MLNNGKRKNGTGRGLAIMGISLLTGAIVGVIVSLYNLVAQAFEGYGKEAYAFVRSNPAFIPLVFVALIAGAFLIAVMIKLVPMIKGSGIPQTEGATRGVMKFNWWKVLVGMSAASLFAIIMGLSAGSEGPSLQIGGACGCGVASTLKRGEVNRRYQITAGSSAGLAVAFNAPLTGVMFAFEEAHRRFSPDIFICALSSVSSAIVVRNLIFAGFGSIGFGGGVASTFNNFDLSPAGIVSTPLALLGFVVLSALIAGLLGVGFYKLCLLARKLFARLTFWKGMGKFIIPFAAAGVLGLLTVNVMGGGHALIESLGTHGGTESMTPESFFGSPIVVTLLVVLAFKILATVLNMGCGVPCGIFIPMLAIGACIGALNGQLLGVMGMDSAFADVITMISMATFFTAVVKAPITAIVMVFELTWSFTALLPVLIGVTVGYMISALFRLEPFYEELLELMSEEMGVHKDEKRESVRMKIMPGSLADGRIIRDVFWPNNALVLALMRGGERVLPESDTKMLSGDVMTIVAQVADRAQLVSALFDIAGKPETPEDDLSQPGREAESNERSITEAVARARERCGDVRLRGGLKFGVGGKESDAETDVPVVHARPDRAPAENGAVPNDGRGGRLDAQMLESKPEESEQPDGTGNKEGKK